MSRYLPASLLLAALTALAAAISGTESATAQVTVVTVGADTVTRGVKRLGINLGARSRFTEAQILKNLIDNPGFEAGEYASVVLADTGSTASAFRQAFINASGSNTQPSGFWTGAEYEIVWGNAKGRSGHIQSFAAQSGRYLFGLDGTGAAPGALDVMLVRRRVPGIAGNTANVDTTTTRPGSPGRQSMRLTATFPRYDFYMDSFWRDGDRSAGKMLPVRGRWRLEVWAKGRTGTETLHGQFMREGTQPFIDQRAALTTTWQHFTWDTDVPPNADVVRVFGEGEYRPILDCRLETGAADQEIWVDDVALYRLDDTNRTVFADAYVERLRELHPGIVRDWSTQFGTSLDAQLAPSHARTTAGSRSDARAPGSWGYGLHDFLELAQELGAEPWYVVPPTFSRADLTNLIEYLAAPADGAHPYADRRAALGQLQPWTDVFATIHLEYGNELWGSGQAGDPFQGASVNGGVRLGAIASDRFAVMRASPSFLPQKFDLVIGGQAGFAGRQQEIQNNASQHDAVALAPYFGVLDSFATDPDIFLPLFATPFYQLSPQGAMRQSANFLAAGSHTARVAIYEINFHTTSGPAPAGIRNNFVTGLDGGVALPLIMLSYQRALGAVDQCAFTALGYSFRLTNGDFVRVWGMLRDLYATGRKRPTWLGVELVNRVILPTALATAQSGDRPLWWQRPINGIGSTTEVEEVQSFAFTDGMHHSLILFNLGLDSSRDARLHLPAAPSQLARRYRLAAAIGDDNEDSAMVAIDSLRITDFTQDYRLALPPHSMTAFTWDDAASTGVAPDARDGHGLAGLSLSAPTPATSASMVHFALDAPADVRLELADMTGRRVAILVDGPAAAGEHHAALAPAGRLTDGCYFLRLSANGRVVVRKVLVGNER